MMDSQIDANEKIQTIDHFTQQLVNSGYKGSQIREIIISSLKGILRKERRGEKEGKSKYRSANESLVDRMNKKLLEVTTWYKETKCHEDSEEDKLIVDFLRSTDSAWKHFRDRENLTIMK